jgi:hypothetical protein
MTDNIRLDDYEIAYYIDDFKKSTIKAIRKDRTPISEELAKEVKDLLLERELKNMKAHFLKADMNKILELKPMLEQVAVLLEKMTFNNPDKDIILKEIIKKLREISFELIPFLQGDDDPN